MKERYRSKVVVFLVLFRDNNNTLEVLLQKRKNTGFMDGMYDFCCSGHLEAGESLKEALIREAKEELDINIIKEDLELVTMLDKYQEEYLLFFFKANKYEGIPKINEVNKCEELRWVDVKNLPDNTIYQIKIAVNNIMNNINYQIMKIPE